MNINELGQLFVTGISGLSLTDEEREFIRDNNIGGVILFKENFQDPAQLAELVNDIQTLRDEYPLFISVDQEGGRVIRFKSHFTQFPSMFEVGQHNSPKLVFEVHKALAEELHACGINLNYSPCTDVWSNDNNKVIGDRAFGKTVPEVEKNISAAIRGLHTGKVLACSKHFPGHGNTTKDSHFDLPYVNKSLEDLRALEIIPFIKASKSRCEFMMMAHLVVDAIDKEMPCTLSEKAYDFLRSELKYKKIIITDDMEMKAITDKFSYPDAGRLAFEAGTDMVMYRSFERTKEVFMSVKEDVQNNKLNKNKMAEKISRVIDCKKRFLSEYKPIYIPTLSKFFKDDRYKELTDKLAQGSL